MVTRQRVRRIVAEVTPGVTATTTRDNSVLPMSLYEGGVVDDRPVDCDRGHLIALEFGGPESRDNLVPMYGGFNAGGAWRTFERELDGYAATKSGTVEVEMICDYPAAFSGGDERIPLSFTVNARLAGAMAIERTWTIAHPRPVPVMTTSDTVLRDLLLAARNEMNHNGWLIENNLGDLSALPSYRRLPQFPIVFNSHESHLQRPYGVLDYIEWKAVKDVSSALTLWRDRIILSATGDFSPTGVARILGANRALHDGGLLSDDSADVVYTQLKYRVIGWPPGTLVPGGRDLAPEVDHMIPRSMGGPAAYSNAQVLSGKQNNDKRARVEAAQRAAIAAVPRGTGRVRAQRRPIKSTWNR